MGSILNGSPRPNGNTAAMVRTYAQGASEAGHTVHIVNVCQKKIAGCLACEYCHTKGAGKCIQQDDMQEVYPLLEEAEMIVLASPIYYHSFSGQLQCAINRIDPAPHRSQCRELSVFRVGGFFGGSALPPRRSAGVLGGQPSAG